MRKMKRKDLIMMLQVIEKEAHISPKRLFSLLNIEHLQPMWEAYDEFNMSSDIIQRVASFLLAHPKISEESKARVHQLLKEHVSIMGFEIILNHSARLEQFLSFLPSAWFNWKVEMYYHL